MARKGPRSVIRIAEIRPIMKATILFPKRACKGIALASSAPKIRLPSTKSAVPLVIGSVSRGISPGRKL
ncbi:MAG TPA: hypothetical protein VF944_09510, partial [Candidatus Bathyarchaeia archaeon]